MVGTIQFEVAGDRYQFSLEAYKNPNTGRRYKLVLSEYGRVHEDSFSDLQGAADLYTEQEIVDEMEAMMAHHLPEDKKGDDPQALLERCFEQFADNHQRVMSL